MSIKLVDFKDIQDAIMEELKLQAADTVSLARVKRVINEVYINEVVPYARWKWLEGNTKIRFNATYFGGTVSVTPNSTTATLSVAPDVSLGSFANYQFSTGGFSEIYIISAHTAGSTTITLSQQYLGQLDSAASFKIWRDSVNLPTDCRETVTVWHNMASRPMEALGSQKFREMTLRAPKAEGYPSYYFTGDYFDPSSGDGELESDRYRQMRIYPAINTKPVTISVDYVKEVTELTNDGDEPVLPLEDRIVLKYGALKTLWRSIMRNPEEAMISAQEYQMKIDRMAGKLEDSHDKPRIQPDSSYIRRRRAPRYRVGGHSADLAGAGGGGTFGQITYLEGVTINGGIITDDITVSAGKTIDGVDIGELSTDFSDHLTDTTDAHDASAISYSNGTSGFTATDVQAAIDEVAAATVGKQSVVLTDNTTDQVVLDLDHATYSFIQFKYSLSRGSGNVETGIINIVHDGTNAAISQGAVANLGTIGVTFTADISGTDVRLLSTTTSTGSAATMKYSIDKWV